MRLRDVFRSRTAATPLRHAQMLHDEERLSEAATAYHSVLALDAENWPKKLEAIYEWIRDRHHSGAAPEHVNEHLAAEAQS